LLDKFQDPQGDAVEIFNEYKEEIPAFYKNMLLIRRFEEQCGRLYMEQKIKGFLHLYIGEEAIATGAISGLRDDDYIITHYRDHGHALARGLDVGAVMAELMGKATGCSGGKGGSMHLFDVSKGFMGGHAIVGAHLPIAVGLAFAIKQQKRDSVVLCFFGDGAVNQGEFHEAMNLSSVWNLPVLFVLENNLYGMGSHVSRTHAAGSDMYKIAESYNMGTLQVDGMDVIEVRHHVDKALEHLRKGEGPLFLEAKTYRFRGHSMADPSAYRESSEVVQWQEKDPIDNLAKLAIQYDIFKESDLEKIDKEIQETVDDAIAFADQSDEPDMADLHNNIYENI
jgi:pyruvate dehydrogenase E1 component alpha subunit